MRFIIFAIFLCVSACGFKPMLAKNEAGHRVIDQIRIAKVEGKDSLRLERLVSENFYSNSQVSKLYDLNISIANETSSQAILKDSVATRYRVKVTINYSLIDVETKNPIDKGSLYLYSGYDMVESELVNYTSERYVSENLLKELCEDLKSRLILVLTAREGIQN